MCDSDKKPLQRHLFIQMRSTSLGLFVYIFQNQDKHYKFFFLISLRVSNNGRVTTERMQMKNRRIIFSHSNLKSWKYFYWPIYPPWKTFPASKMKPWEIFPLVQDTSICIGGKIMPWLPAMMTITRLCSILNWKWF